MDGSNKNNAIFRAISWHFSNSTYTGKIQPYDKRHSKFNPWMLMPAAVIVQFCCGSLYAWSVFNEPIDEEITGDAESSQAAISFYIAVGMLGFSAAFMGPWIERNGPRKSLIVASSIFFLGNLISALAIYWKDMFLLYIGYGVVGGFAIGISYVTPVSSLQSWFPHKRGLAAGFGVCGFGGGSIVIGKVILPLISAVGLPMTFVVLGCCYFVAMVSSAFVFRLPPPGYSPFSRKQLKKMAKLTPQPEIKLTAMESIKSLDFCLIYVVLLSNILFGLVAISRLSNMITQLFSKNAHEAATMVSINGGLNLFGRLFFSVISDKIGRKSCFIIMLMAQFFVVVTLPFYIEQDLYIPFLASMFTLTMCYGGGFGCVPAFLADMFGASNVGVCFGLILTAWSVGGVAGGLTFTAIYNYLIQHGYSTDDAYPYVVNSYWILSFIIIGLLSAIFVRTSLKDRLLPPVHGEWFKFRIFSNMIRIKKVSTFPQVQVLSSEQYDEEWEKYLQSLASSQTVEIEDYDENCELKNNQEKY
ncbi:putative MFS-type transporter YhjX [Pseudolycoriella hygida]|uniref:MFS-type transporter YhjX n=1 Tax=Pseudolycoriella hygida TaxID=35572 RepID=A0A9Q0MRN0_9DIPT|nr:putative MFS-type transporter YhjX [Pseudolycoriella hygida]